MTASGQTTTPDNEASRLAVGIAALSSFQQVTQQGDGKANMLLAVHVGLSAVLATQLQEIHHVPAGGGAVVFWLVSAVYLTSFLVDGYLIAQIIRPRGADIPTSNPLAFPSSAVAADPRATSDHVWELARALGAVAARKNAYVSRAVGWTALMVVSAAAWLGVLAAVVT